MLGSTFTSGNLSSSEHIFKREAAYFTGPGLVSKKRTLCKGKRKELVFYSQFYEKMNSYNTVEFETRKGFFGFDILENKKLN